MQYLSALRRALLAPAVLALLVLALYAQTRQHDFIRYDDPIYVTRCEVVQRGLTSEGVRFAFGRTPDGHRVPLTWLSHMAVVEAAGLDPGWHHLANVLLHLGNVLLLYALARSMGGRELASFTAAALLAIHPLHVESVAWVTERKDVLSLFFGLATMLAWLRFARRPGAFAYAGVVVLYALALSAKATMTTLPAVLVLLDVWPLRRAAGARDLAKRAAEKFPLFAMAGAVAVLTIRAQSSVEAMSVPASPLWNRAALSVVHAGIYLRQLAFPSGLAIFHPMSTRGWWEYALSALAIGGLTREAIRGWPDRPWLAIGWLWFLGTIAPFLGILQAGAQETCDHYAYLPAVGLYAAIGLQIGRMGERRPRAALATSAAIIAWLLPWTWLQIATWKDDETLYRRALAVDEDSPIAHVFLGDIEFERGDLEAAGAHYDRAGSLAPDATEPLLGWGRVRAALGDHDAAVLAFEAVLRRDAEHSAAESELGRSYLELGRSDLALQFLDEALALRPDHAQTLDWRGCALIRLGRIPEAIESLSRSVELAPALVEPRVNLGAAYLMGRRPAEAVPVLEAAVELAPGHAQARNNLAVARLEAGDVEGARGDLAILRTLDPEMAAGLEPRFEDR